VLLNLFNNAFYAVNERKKTEGDGYEPEVVVHCGRADSTTTIKISVQDNGTGIPESIKDKIFQPFFTTKPTGQGTGLGLSLSYDIVKAHGGAMEASSKEGEGSIFTIRLPA
jgi:signal transduction histidine kinase